MNKGYSSNKLVTPGSKAAIDAMKYEIANEMGINLGPDASAKANGQVGGEITKRLVAMAQSQLSGTSGTSTGTNRYSTK